MATIDTTYDGPIATIRFNRPKAHAINRTMVEEMLETFSRLEETDRVEAVVLTGSGNIFCAGLDLVEIYNYDEEAFDRFWSTFHRVMIHMLSFPKPLAAAVNGHAPAGGCVFAMCCDYRVMAEGKYGIGLNEVPVGVVMPRTLVELAAWRVGRTKAEQMLLNGLLMNAEEAVSFGLVDDKCPAGEAELWADMRLKKWMGMHRDAWRKTKVALRKPLLETLDMSLNEGYGDMIREWWSVDGRSAVKRTIDRFKRAGADTKQ